MLHVFISFLVLFGLLSGHLLGNSCSLGLPYVLIIFSLLVILVISRFAFEGWIWVLIASVPGLCILFTFTTDDMSRVVRKPAFCICENKDADQLRGNREADQRLCFRYTDSTIPLLPKSEISSL